MPSTIERIQTISKGKCLCVDYFDSGCPYYAVVSFRSGKYTDDDWGMRFLMHPNTTDYGDTIEDEIDFRVGSSDSYGLGKYSGSEQKQQHFPYYGDAFDTIIGGLDIVDEISENSNDVLRTIKYNNKTYKFCGFVMYFSNPGTPRDERNYDCWYLGSKYNTYYEYEWITHSGEFPDSDMTVSPVYSLSDEYIRLDKPLVVIDDTIENGTHGLYTNWKTSETFDTGLNQPYIITLNTIDSNGNPNSVFSKYGVGYIENLNPHITILCSPYYNLDREQQVITPYTLDYENNNYVDYDEFFSVPSDYAAPPKYIYINFSDYEGISGTTIGDTSWHELIGFCVYYISGTPGDDYVENAGTVAYYIPLSDFSEFEYNNNHIAYFYAGDDIFKSKCISISPVYKVKRQTYLGLPIIVSDVPTPSENGDNFEVVSGKVDNTIFENISSYDSENSNIYRVVDNINTVSSNNGVTGKTTGSNLWILSEACDYLKGRCAIEASDAIEDGVHKYFFDFSLDCNIDSNTLSRIKYENEWPLETPYNNEDLQNIPTTIDGYDLCGFVIYCNSLTKLENRIDFKNCIGSNYEPNKNGGDFAYFVGVKTSIVGSIITGSDNAKVYISDDANNVCSDCEIVMSPVYLHPTAKRLVIAGPLVDGSDFNNTIYYDISTSIGNYSYQGTNVRITDTFDVGDSIVINSITLETPDFGTVTGFGLYDVNIPYNVNTLIKQYNIGESIDYSDLGDYSMLWIEPHVTTTKHVSVILDSAIQSGTSEVLGDIDYKISVSGLGDYSKGESFEIAENTSVTIDSIILETLNFGTVGGFGLYNGEQLVKEYTTLPQEISYDEFESYSSLYLRPIINTIKSTRVILSDGIGDDGHDLGSVVYSVMVDGSPYSKGSSFEISEDSDGVTVTYNYTDTIYSNTAIYTFSRFEIYYDGHICYIENGGTLKYDVIKDYDVVYLRPLFTHTDKPSIEFSIINQTCRNLRFVYTTSISGIYVDSNPSYWQPNGTGGTMSAWSNCNNDEDGSIKIYFNGPDEINLSSLFDYIYIDTPSGDVDIKECVDFSQFNDTTMILSPSTIMLDMNYNINTMKINYYTGLRKTRINIFNLMSFGNSVVVRSYSDKDNTKIYSTFSDDKYYNESFESYIEGLLTTPEGSSNIMSQEGRELILQGKLNFSVSAFEYSKNTSFSGITFSTTHVVDKLYHTSSESTTENDETATRTIKLNKNDSTQLYYVDSMSDIEDVNDDIWGKVWKSSDLKEGCPDYNEVHSKVQDSLGDEQYQGNGIFNFITTISSIEYIDDLFFDYEYYHCGTLVGYVNERSENTFIKYRDNLFFGVTEPGIEATTIYGYDDNESERTLFALRQMDVELESSNETDISPSIIDASIASDIKKTLWDDSFSMPLDYCSLQTGNQFILFRLRNPYNGKVLNFDEDSAYGYTSSGVTENGIQTSSTSQDNGDQETDTSTKYNMTHEQPYFLTLWEQRSIFNALNGKPTYVNETSRSENMSESYIETNFANNSSDDEDTAGIVNQYCEWYTNYINGKYSEDGTAPGSSNPYTANSNLYFTITEKNPRKAGRALVENIDDWFNWYKREEEPGEITDGTPTDLPGGSPLMFVGPYLNQDYDMCIQSDATQSSLTLGPGESITVPIIVLYKCYESSGRDSCRYALGFDLRNSLYNDPLYYQFTLNAKYSASVNDSVSSQKASIQSSTRYNTTVR